MATLLTRFRSWFCYTAPNPREQTFYIYQPERAAITYEQAVDALSSRGYTVLRGGIDIESPDRVVAITTATKEAGISLYDVTLDVTSYREYLMDVDYGGRYPDYYTTNLPEKSLEHFICLTYLSPSFGDVLIDVASEHSPLPEIFSRLTGCVGYSQDIMYPAGLDGRHIGGDACNMPVSVGFADAACLTCSFEHFEGGSDTRLFRELYRVLKPGARVVVAPFYLSDVYAIQTDPLVAVSANVSFDADAAIYCAEGWGNRHARFYSPSRFEQRIIAPCRDLFSFTCYRVTNTADLSEGTHLKFFFVAIRK